MALCDLESPTLDRDAIAHKQRRSHDVSVEHADDSFEIWELQLFDDSSNTRSYVCRCLVQLAGLSEEDSYSRMMHAHKHGKVAIGEYCREHAEHYKEALTTSGLVCEIIPVEE